MNEFYSSQIIKPWDIPSWLFVKLTVWYNWLTSCESIMHDTFDFIPSLELLPNRIDKFDWLLTPTMSHSNGRDAMTEPSLSWHYTNYKYVTGKYSAACGFCCYMTPQWGRGACTVCFWKSWNGHEHWQKFTFHGISDEDSHSRPLHRGSKVSFSVVSLFGRKCG